MSVLTPTARLLVLSLLGSAQAGVGTRQSHRAAEPEVQPGHKFQPEGNSLEGGPGPWEKERREKGSVLVGKRWEFPVAEVEGGLLWGSMEESRGGARILAFRGVKHLQAPTGDLRWAAPVPEAAWEGVRDAKHNGHVCPQHLATKRDTWVGDEDCLWLNVFTKDLVRTKKRPVLVWIHGGNFARGSAAEYDPDYLLDQEVVLVTVQYRLGMFGFLSTETAEAPGNYGMLDQVAALHWVKKNIAAFSGDPNSVTILGQQAGGASVHYHLLSPLSRGLFQRAVSMSGSALCWWASLKRHQEKAMKLGKLVKCQEDAWREYSGNMTLLLDCLKEQPMEALMNNHPNFYSWQHLEENQEPLTAWSPRVDTGAALSFLPQEPLDVMTTGGFQHLPWIVGITDDEGANRAHAFFSDARGVREFEEQFEKLGPLMFGLADGQSTAPKIMAKKVKDFYWGESALGEESSSSLVDAISDSSYAHPIDTASKVHFMRSSDPVFVYHFGYRGEHSLTHLRPNTYPPRLEKTDRHYGVGNGDDLMYLFPILQGLFRPLNNEDLKFSHRQVN